MCFAFNTFAFVTLHPITTRLEDYIATQVGLLSRTLEKELHLKNRLHVILVRCTRHYLDWARGLAAAAMVVSCCFSAVQGLVLVLLCSQLRLRSLGALG